MFFHKARDVEFVGGPFDGHRQTISLSSDDGREVIAIPVTENVFRMLAGIHERPRAPASSFAIYELTKHKGEYRYYFTGAKSPKEFDVKNQWI